MGDRTRAHLHNLYFPFCDSLVLSNSPSQTCHKCRSWLRVNLLLDHLQKFYTTSGTGSNHHTWFPSPANTWNKLSIVVFSLLTRNGIDGTKFVGSNWHRQGFVIGKHLQTINELKKIQNYGWYSLKEHKKHIIENWSFMILFYISFMTNIWKQDVLMNYMK